ncbi:MAG: NusG domain II-containing protein [Clostridiales bacterium]|nr:NusG domain II-containing protein [Clostridiales bacterium]
MANREKFLKKGDIIIALIVVVLALVMLLPRYINKSDNPVAVITKNGEEIYCIELNKVEQGYDINIESVVIRVEKGKIFFSDSDCKDKICVKSGKLSHIGDTSACLPNKVVITIKGVGSSGVDAITY